LQPPVSKSQPPANYIPDPLWNVMSSIKKIILFFPVLFFPFLLPAQKVGLVLSGGGVRGLAHIGVIKALEENNIPIDYITGTSAGALVGCLYAVGMTPAQMEKLVTDPKFGEWASGKRDEDLDYYFVKNDPNASWVQFKLSLDSLLQLTFINSIINSSDIDFNLMEQLSAPIAKANYDFNNLFVPYRCVAADIVTKESIVLSKGDLAQSVRASMAYPVYFSPVITDGKILYDGGIYNNFPVDVMQKDFNPDVIIGVNAGGYMEVPIENNLINQFRTMLVQTTHYTVNRDSDVLVVPNVGRYDVFDFRDTKSVIDSGYNETIRNIDRIRKSISRRTSHEEVTLKRDRFLSGMHGVVIDKIHVKGLNDRQSEYIRRRLKPNANTLIDLNQLRRTYFKLVADDNIRYIFPTLLYNPQSGYYDLFLEIKREKDLRIEFGGNFSSRPISNAYLGLQYNMWRINSLKIMMNAYFGKLYTSGQVKVRYDLPGMFPVYFEPGITLNNFDYYRSSNAFIADLKPSYLVEYDRSYSAAFGIPVRNKGKLEFESEAFKLSNKYYQTRYFLESDTADRTRFEGLSFGLNFQRSTLNRKMYADQGTYFSLRTRYVEGNEVTEPGSKSTEKDTLNQHHDWWHLRMTWDNYFEHIGRLKLGFYSDIMISNQPFFANYTATILAAPAFQPLQETKTLFLEKFSAHNFIGVGLKNVFSIRKNFDARLEGYIFQPYQSIIQNPVTLKAEYAESFSNRYFLGTFGFVYHSPVGPVSISVNYYDKFEKPFTVLFHFGYIIFNKKALD
jgi:NTE family protein